VDLAPILVEEGALDLILHWLETESETVAEVALEWTRSLDPGEAWLRSHVLKYVEEPEGVPSRVLNKALWALALPQHEWAVDPLLDFIEKRVRDLRPDGHLRDGVGSAADALATIGERRAIPRLIGACLADRSTGGEGQRLIGHFGLCKLTGVPFAENQDGAWWLAWWEENRDSLPPEVAVLEVPRF
jgi:hypothetical protein